MYEKDNTSELNFDPEILNAMTAQEIDAIIEDVEKDENFAQTNREIEDSFKKEEEERQYGNPKVMIPGQEVKLPLPKPTDNDIEETTVKPSKTYPEYNVIKLSGYDQSILVHSTAKLGKNLNIGRSTPTIGSNSAIGDNCTVLSARIGSNVTVDNGTSLGVATQIGKKEYRNGDSMPPVTIGKHVKIKNGVKVSPNTVIKDFAEIGASSQIGDFKRKDVSMGYPTKRNVKNKKTNEDKKTSRNKVAKTIINEGVVIGERVKIESGAKIPKGYIIADNTFIPKKLKLPELPSNETKTLSNYDVEHMLVEARSK